MVRRVLVMASLAACAVLLGGCIVLSGNSPLPGQPATGTPEPSATTGGKPVTHGLVGEKLSAGPWTVTIEEAARTGKAVGGRKPAVGQDLLTITVGFENMGTDSLVVRPDDFTLTDANGKRLQRADTSQAAFNASSMRPLQPRFGTSTIFVFNVPKGRTRYTFAFTPPGQNTTLQWLVP